jgi:FHS family L-fucose permease-like MFS transporter
LMQPTVHHADIAGTPPRFSRDLQAFVFSLFFVFGGITSLNDVIIPKLKALFTLSNGEAMLVQSAFFGAYFFLSLPAAALLRRIGYMQSAAVGLLTMTAGCLLFVPASEYGLFLLFLLALFVLAAGITTVQVVANPLISMLGPPATASSRLTFAQAFNSVGTTVFPYVGSTLILGSLATLDPATLSGAALNTFRSIETRVIVHAYLGLAVALAALALVVWVRRQGLIESPPTTTPILSAFNLLRRPRFSFGTACIFLYVGAEVAIGSSIVIYLMQDSVLAMTAVQAGKYYVPLYWGGAMVGRFIGGFVLRSFAPGKVLACAAAAAVALLLTSATGSGAVSAWSLLAVGLFNSIMFPTIFSLASEGLGARAAEGSGIMCVAIVGGAIIPPLTGHAADVLGWKMALMVPAACYCCILAYGWWRASPVDRG